MLAASGRNAPKVRMGSPGSFIEVMSEKIDNPLEFSRLLKEALQSRGSDVLKFNVSHLYGSNFIFSYYFDRRLNIIVYVYSTCTSLLL